MKQKKLSLLIILIYLIFTINISMMNDNNRAQDYYMGKNIYMLESNKEKKPYCYTYV